MRLERIKRRGEGMFVFLRAAQTVERRTVDECAVEKRVFRMKSQLRKERNFTSGSGSHRGSDRKILLRNVAN